MILSNARMVVIAKIASVLLSHAKETSAALNMAAARRLPPHKYAPSQVANLLANAALLVSRVVVTVALKTIVACHPKLEIEQGAKNFGQEWCKRISKLTESIVFYGEIFLLIIKLRIAS